MNPLPLPLTSASALPDVGTLLGGKYQLVRFIAAGGMGAVFEAQHVKLGRRVAVKVLLPQRQNEGQLAARFLREARALARLHHRHVAQVLDVDETPGGLPYMVLEYLEGSDLTQLMPSRKAMPVEAKLKHLRGVCDALEQAHAQGIIHRDIKPANLFMAQTPEGPCLKLFDFGIAHTEDDADAKLTQGVTLGTPDFMSPEQLQGQALSPASDVWSLAVTTYEWVADALPFEGRDTRARTTAILSAPPIPLTQRSGTFPPDLWPVLEAALEKDPTRRTPTARAFAEGLERALAARTDVVSRAPATPRPRRLAPVVLGGAVLVLAIGAVVTFLRVSATHPEAPVTSPAVAAPPSLAPVPIAAPPPAEPRPSEPVVPPAPVDDAVAAEPPPALEAPPPAPPAVEPPPRRPSGVPPRRVRPGPTPPPAPEHPKYL